MLRNRLGDRLCISKRMRGSRLLAVSTEMDSSSDEGPTALMGNTGEAMQSVLLF
jgi:hypothetical protein